MGLEYPQGTQKCSLLRFLLVVKIVSEGVIFFLFPPDAVSAPSIKRKGLFVFIADQCKARKRSLKEFQYNLNHLIVGM